MYGQLGDGTTEDRNVYKKVFSNAKAVAAGTRHSMVVKNDGSVWTTLFNVDGKSRESSQSRRGIFVQVISSGAEAIAASNYHSMVLKQDGTVWAAGSNKFGQLGHSGPYKNSIRNFVKIQIVAGAVHDAMAG